MNFCFVELEGLKVRVGQRHSNDAAPPLLVLNGIGIPMEAATALLEAMPNRSVISLDVPGVGQSTTPSGPYRLSTLTALIDQLLDQLGISAIDILGVSWGGALAQQFVRDFPERCRRLILAATSAGAAMIPGKPSALLQLAIPDSDLAKQVGRLLMPRVWEGLNPLRPEPKRKRGYLYQLIAVTGWTSIHWLHRLRLPTLILMGDEDPIVPLANGHLLSKRIPDATLLTFTGGHLFMLEQPDKVAQAIERFLASTD